MLIASWSDSHQVGTTTNLLSLATAVPLVYEQLNAIIFHANKERSSLESFMESYIKAEDAISSGVAELENLFHSGILRPEHLNTHVRRILEGKLYVLEGRNIGASQIFDSFLPILLELLSQRYKLAFVDVPTGLGKKAAHDILTKADVVVVNLTQNEEVLRHFFTSLPTYSPLQGKELFYCIGNYEENSHNTMRKISKAYNISSSNIGVVPRNVKLLDSCNSGTVPDFILKAMAVTTKDWSYDDDKHFADHLKSTVSSLVKLTGIPIIK